MHQTTSYAVKLVCFLIPDRDGQVTVNLWVIGKGDVEIGTLLGRQGHRLRIGESYVDDASGPVIECNDHPGTFDPSLTSVFNDTRYMIEAGRVFKATRVYYT